MKRCLFIVVLITQVCTIFCENKKRAVRPQSNNSSVRKSSRKSNLAIQNAANSVAKEPSWTPISSDEVEYRRLIVECSIIAESFGGGQSLGSSARANAIFAYLKNIGTPVSLRVLKEQIAMGRVPAHYLKQI